MPQISFNTSNNTVPLKSPNLYTTNSNPPTITTNTQNNIAYNPTIYNATRPSAINTAVQNVTLASAAGRLSGSNVYTTAHPASTNVRFGYGGATGGSYTTSTYGANNRATFTSAVPVTTTAVHTTSPTVISTAQPVTTSTYVAPAPVSTSYTQQVYTPAQQIVQQVRNPVTVSQVQRVETTPVRHTEQYDQYDRNTYERNSQNVKVQERRQVVADAPKKQTNCCGPVCWALLGLLALAGLILGLLFGLGVIGGRGAGASTDAATNGTNTNGGAGGAGGSTTINGTTTTNGTSTNGTFTSGGISTNTQYAFPPASGTSSVTVDTTVIYDQDGQPNSASSGSSGTTSNSTTTTTTTTSTTTTPSTTSGTSTSGTSTSGTSTSGSSTSGTSTSGTSTSGSSTSTTTTSTSGTATLPTASLPVRHKLRVSKHI